MPRPGRPTPADSRDGGTTPGTLLRAARTTRGLTLAQAGEMCGYSASTLSRLERGQQALRDVSVLRHLCLTLDIPPEWFGLAPGGAAPEPGTLTPPTLDPAGLDEGGDPMRRRELLAGLVALPLTATSAGTTLDAALANTAPPGSTLAAALRDVLLHSHPSSGPESSAGPSTLEEVRAELAACMSLFQRSRYAPLTTRLPSLVRHALPDVVDEATRAEINNLVVRVLIKLEIPGLAWLAAERATTAARNSGDPLVYASITRNVASLCRRDGHHASAQALALDACTELTVTGPAPEPAHLSMYGMLLLNAGYAAAQQGDRARSLELLDFADETATRLGERNDRWTAFGPANVTLHRVSAAYALGDAGTAIAHARTVDLTRLRLPERRSRFWVDVARAYRQWGKPRECLQALTIAEHQAPDEVRARPTVRALATGLLESPMPLPGLRDFSRRVGALA